MAVAYDFVIEAVRYAADGKIAQLRGYERRGATYSDHIIISRAELVERIKNKKKCATGHRREFMASSFEIGKPVSLVNDLLTTGPSTGQDNLQDVPVF